MLFFQCRRRDMKCISCLHVAVHFYTFSRFHHIFIVSNKYLSPINLIYLNFGVSDVLDIVFPVTFICLLSLLNRYAVLFLITSLPHSCDSDPQTLSWDFCTHNPQNLREFSCLQIHFSVKIDRYIIGAPAFTHIGPPLH